MSRSASPDHYSYTHYADPQTARTFDDRRFGGPIGRIVAEAQADVVGRFAGDTAGRRILDVGTGTGRAALLFARAGAVVTGIDASEEMLAIARDRARTESTTVRFERGDAHELPFADRSFDVVVCLRVLMHTPDWPRVIAELCRVAGGRVIADYPSTTSVAALQALSRRVSHAVGARTEPYRVFTERQIGRAFEAHGFEIVAAHRQFVLPIALHKAVNSPAFTTWSEGALRRAGLLRPFGSPVTIAAARCGPS